MAASLANNDADPFAKYKEKVLEKFLERQDPNQLLIMAVASPAIRKWIVKQHYKPLDFSVLYARYAHEEPWPGHARTVQQFTNASLYFAEPDEVSLYLAMLAILRKFDDYPVFLTFAVVLAQDYNQAKNITDFLLRSGIYAYLSYGFPAPATRKRFFSRGGLAVMVLFRLGGELDRQPDVLISMQLPTDTATYQKQLKIGGRDHFNICSIEDNTCLTICQLRNTMSHFATDCAIMPTNIILPAGLLLS